MGLLSISTAPEFLTPHVSKGDVREARERFIGMDPWTKEHSEVERLEKTGLFFPEG